MYITWILSVDHLWNNSINSKDLFVIEGNLWANSKQVFLKWGQRKVSRLWLWKWNLTLGTSAMQGAECRVRSSQVVHPWWVAQFHSFSGCPSEGGWHISQFSGCPSEPIGGWHSFWLGCTSGSPRWRGCRRAEDGSGRQASLQSPAAKGSASSCWPAKACCQLEGASYSTSQPQPPHCLSAQDVQESSMERAGEDFVCDSHALEE